MPRTRETYRLALRARVSLDRTVDGTTRQLVTAWARAWSEIAAEYQEAVDDLVARSVDGKWPPRHVINRAARAQKALAHAADQLESLGSQAGVSIGGKLRDTAAASVSAAESIVLSQLPRRMEIGWTSINDRAIDTIVTRSTQQVESALRPLAKQAADVMKRELVRGVSAGTNPRVAARRMIARSRVAFLGGLPRANNIARTEILDAYRVAGDQARSLNRSVLRGWEWMATLDHRTCGSCLAQHGTLHPLSEGGPHDHQQGRCTALPVTKTWAELGIDAPEPKFPERPTGEEWFNSQTTKVQQRIVGPTRLKALQDGKIGFSDLSVKRANPGWRDSYGMPSVTAR